MGRAWQQGPLALGSVGRFLVPGRLPVDGAEAAIRAASPGVRASRRRQPCDATEAQVVAVIAVASSPNEGSGEVLAGFEPRAPTGQARVRVLIEPGGVGARRGERRVGRRQPLLNGLTSGL
jgi:hypothetical protein